jgi:drug/metabolite transporter (DMT)-like permease
MWYNLNVNWLWFAVLGIAAYVIISLMGQLAAGDSRSGVGAALRLFTPYAFITLIIGNALWAMALYFGLKETRAAIPALIAIGVITASFYSYIFLGDGVTIQRIFGVILVLTGIYFLA